MPPAFMQHMKRSKFSSSIGSFVGLLLDPSWLSRGRPRCWPLPSEGEQVVVLRLQADTSRWRRTTSRTDSARLRAISGVWL